MNMMKMVVRAGGRRILLAACLAGAFVRAEADSARWYRGMIHAHTIWSDGRALPEQAVAAYKNGGYDFFAITDHNRVGADTNRWIGVAPSDGKWPPKAIEPSVFEAFKAAFPGGRWRVRDGRTEVRLSTMAEIAAQFNEPGKFLFMPGFEITTAILGADGVRRDLHMNGVGLDEVIPRYRDRPFVERIKDASLGQVMREAKDQVDALAAAKGNAPHIFVVNHPHWRYCDVLPEDVLAHPDIRFFEVCNTGSEWPSDAALPQDGFDNDRFWDAVNAARCLRGEPLLYGLATEDSHWYPGSGTSHSPVVFGDAWIGVRAGSLTPGALFAAMGRGDFYAAGGVDLDDVRFDEATGTLSVSVPAKAAVAYTVKFITTKRGVDVRPVRTVTLPAKDARPVRHVPVYADGVGAVAQTVSFGKGAAAQASYTLQPDDLYVRARIESDEPAVYPNAARKMHPPMKVAWTQPYRGRASAPAQTAATPDLRDGNAWGRRAEHLAVVNPVVADDSGSVLSLRGEWEFTPQRMKAPWRNGVWRHFYEEKWPDARTIRVPGCWEAQGVGEPGPSECWDPVWDNCAKPIRHKHMGDGWYRRTVPVPTAWEGKRIWLKVGGVKSCGWFWVNGKQVALVANYCGTYKYEITDLVTPGSNATITVQVNNVRPSRKGLMSILHRWGGLYRDVELEATPPTFLDDVWVRGDFDAQAAEAHVTVAGSASGLLRFSVDGETVEKPVSAGGETVLRLPLKAFRPWSPERPNLYTGLVEWVENGKVVHARRERFGVRKLEVRGAEFFLNGRPFFVRGFGDDAVYPLTGLSPADREIHRAHLAKAREAGFNFVRLHTHCELPEYFEAADELGILVQAELPYYSDVPTEGFEFDPVRDVTELWRNYRRHPSFAVYSMGNEGSFGAALDRRLHVYVKAMDPDRLKINQDCHMAEINPPEAADYRGGPIKEWPRGSVNPDRPFVTHEYLNLCIKLDSRGEADYTGAWLPPVTRAARAAWLAQSGLDMVWGDRLQDAQHALQRHYQQQGIEAARRDPYCDGYCFWTVVDVVVAQGSTYTAQGLFAPFWRQKRGGFSAREFARFNSPSCLLLDLPDENRVFTSGERLSADILFAHYGDAPLKDAVLDWRLDAAGTGGASVQGQVALAGEIACGPARKITTVPLTFPAVEKPTRAAFVARIGDVSNSWDFWIFPPRRLRDGSDLAVSPPLTDAMGRLYADFAATGTPEAEKAAVVVAAEGSPEAEKALAKGRRVVIVGKASGVPNVKLGWWWMGDQVGTALVKHPVFGDLPHEGHLSPLLFRIVGKGKPLEGAGYASRDLFMVGEGGKGCFAYLAQRPAKDGKGFAVESFGLDLLSGKPEGTAILDGMIDYARSHK